MLCFVSLLCVCACVCSRCSAIGVQAQVQEDLHKGCGTIPARHAHPRAEPSAASPPPAAARTEAALPQPASEGSPDCGSGTGGLHLTTLAGPMKALAAPAAPSTAPVLPGVLLPPSVPLKSEEAAW